jgi:hypothetical protein
MPWRAPPPDRTPPKPQPSPQDRETTLLMLQWIIWKHVGSKVIMDGERMQRLAETLALEFYTEGCRLPNNDDPLEAVIDLQHELKLVGDEIGPVPIPQKALRERQHLAAKKLFERGWRKYAVIAAVLALIEVGTAAVLVARPVVGS